MLELTQRRARSLAFSVVASIALLAYGCGDNEPPSPARPSYVDPLAGVLKRLEAASDRPLEARLLHGRPTSLSGSITVSGASSVERARTFLREYADLFGLGDRSKLELRHTGGDDDEHVVFYQMFEGLPVYGGGLTLSFAGDRLYAVVGRVLRSDEPIDTTPAFDARRAIDLARTASAGPGFGSGVLRAEPTLMLVDPEVIDARHPSRLAAVPSRADSAAYLPRAPQLVWRVVVDETELLLDARTGAVVHRAGLSPDGLDGFDLYVAVMVLVSESSSGQKNYTGAVAADENGVNPAYAGDPQVVALASHASVVYDFFHSSFGRKSYDDHGDQILIEAHGSTSGGASWAIGRFEFRDDFVALDVLGHEFTHAVIDYGSNLVYANQSGALNEGYADLMGNLVDPTNWLCADLAPVGAIRDMGNPTAFGDPDRFSLFVKLPTTWENDWGGVHTNSGIPNKAHYLITEGGVQAGIAVTGIGRPRMAQLAYAAITSLHHSADFLDARDFEVATATEWGAIGVHGFTPLRACSVRNGWAAAEVGAAVDVDCDGVPDSVDPDDDHDFVPDAVDNCPNVYNPAQKNTSTAAGVDSVGDACDEDADNDGMIDLVDNCSLPNANQADSDHDGVGDPCDDLDFDGIDDDIDNCVGIANPDQADGDKDREGDACDPDVDGDGAYGFDDDNCQFIPNPDQADADGDGLGDVCDACPMDVDKVSAWAPGLPEFGIPPHALVPDSNGNGIPDSCDPLGRLARRVDVDGSPSRGTALPPDGTTRNVVVHPGGGSGPDAALVALPIEPCVGPCPEWIRQDYAVKLELAGLPSEVPAWIADEAGRLRDGGYDGRIHGQPRAFLFTPQGGRRYWLYLDTTAAPGATLPFAVSLSAGRGLERPASSALCLSSADCSDGDACNGSETCDESTRKCAASSAPACDDGDPCTTDACDKRVGCTHARVDADGDGAAPTSFGACGTDCDDTRRDIAPGAAEMCDGVDNNCNGSIDDAVVTTACYRDADGDGYGDSGMTMAGCSCAAGFVPGPPTGALDCWDGPSPASVASRVHPGQLAYFATPYCAAASCPPGIASFDYDCAGGPEPRWSALYGTCTSVRGGCAGGGWVSVIPACGGAGRYRECVLVRDACVADPAGPQPRVQECR